MALPATITLTGNPDHPQPTLAGGFSKALFVRDGALTAHGAPPTHPWTRLVRDAAAGDMAVWLEGAVDWAAGNQIVLAPTGLFYDEVCDEFVSMV
jgi:hypothetical protein